MSVRYVDYKELNEFYTVSEACKLFSIDKQALRQKCEQYGIELRRNEIGEWGLVNAGSA